MNKIKIGISSCLLGNKVRYNGQHKMDRYIKDTLGQWFDFIPVCPEVECGLPTPRESMHLEGSADSPRLITTKTRADLTVQMSSWIEQKLKQLEKEELLAFIFKTKSPSSGMRSIKIFTEQGEIASYQGKGLFAKAFIEHFPDIPVEDEGRLHDPGIRENFIESIFILQRWRSVSSVSDLVQFHQNHKYTFMSRSPLLLKKMGKLTADAGKNNKETVFSSYFNMLDEILDNRKTVKKNTNVLQHITGYFKENIDHSEKKELLKEIKLYHQGISPLIVPLTLIRHYTQKYEEPYLSKQHYLFPHPAELGLLNHV